LQQHGCNAITQSVWLKQEERWEAEELVLADRRERLGCGLPRPARFLGCLIIAILSFAFLAVTAFEAPTTAGRITVFTLAGGILFVYVVGGMGVRESNWHAAAMIFVLYVVNQLGSGRAPSLIPVIIGAVLLSNVRATFLASRWKPIEEDEDRPMRFNETFRDKLVDQLPPRLWPILRIPFFVAAGLLFLFLCYVSAVMLLRPHPAMQIDDNATPSATVTVDPPDSK
jgi:hypothetical protein